MSIIKSLIAILLIVSYMMGDDSINMEIKSRLRNHSYKESLGNTISTKMSANMPEIHEEELADAEAKLIMKEDFQKKNTTQKLDSMAEAINKMYDKMNKMTSSIEDNLKPSQDALFDEDNGVLPKVSHLMQHTKSVDESMQGIMEENLQLRDELDILKGVVHRMSRQLDVANSKINMLLTKSMEDNLIFTGILDDLPKKDPRQQLHQFLYHKMHLTDIYDSDILSVYRLGKPEKGKNRAIVAHCTSALRRHIQKNQATLCDQTNDSGGKYYINQQLPDAVSEQRREIREQIKERRDKEESEKIPKSARSTFAVKADKLFINGQLQRKKILPPSVQQLFPDQNEQKTIDKIKFKFFHTEPEHGSSFKAAVFRPESMNQVHHAYIKLVQEFPTADHIAVACVVKFEQAYQDNGEHGSAFRILRCIKEATLDNVAVFILRPFRGTHLGPRRFKIMAELTRAALEKAASFPDPNSTPSSPQRSRSSSISSTTLDNGQRIPQQQNSPDPEDEE